MKIVYFYLFDSHKTYAFSNQDLNFGADLTFSLIGKDDNYSLITQKNENYVQGFHDKFINISCIIGENGSGKTSLLKFLQFIINEEAIKKKSHSYNFPLWDYFAVFKDNDQLHFRLNTPNAKIQVYYKGKSIIKKSISANLLSAFYSGFPNLSNEFNFSSPGFIDVSTEFLIHKRFEDKDEDFDLGQVEYFSREDVKSQLRFKHEVDTWQLPINDILNKITPKYGKIFPLGNIEKIDTEPRYINYPSIRYLGKLREQFQITSSILTTELREIADERSEDPNYYNVETGQRVQELFVLLFKMRLVDCLFYNVETRGDMYIDDSHYREDIVNQEYNDDQKLDVFIEFFKIQNTIINENKNELFNLIKEFETTSQNLEWTINSDYFECNVNKLAGFLKIEDEILRLMPYKNVIPLVHYDWGGMSTGEKAMFTLFSRINESYLIGAQSFKNRQFSFLLLDEPEAGFHPQWQQEYLHYLISFLRVRFNQMYLHVIITTHSPFVITDIPDYAVVKLGAGANTIYERRTFGSNIYDLLADSFYLPGGFMGIIAKQKILNLTDFLTGKNKNFTYQEAQKTIHLIGEPLIRNRLQQLFDEKYGTEESKEEILKKIKALQNKLKKRRDD
ncbi:MAG: ATP-binding protein domain [Bacteroidetes bacterium]|jgi:predicted ATPase|nr:ATP-binding protein domain [Bacteroidota bacterium]